MAFFRRGNQQTMSTMLQMTPAARKRAELPWKFNEALAILSLTLVGIKDNSLVLRAEHGFDWARNDTDLAIEIHARLKADEDIIRVMQEHDVKFVEITT